jgi:hypothetical protein
MIEPRDRPTRPWVSNLVPVAYCILCSGISFPSPFSLAWRRATILPQMGLRADCFGRRAVTGLISSSW